MTNKIFKTNYIANHNGLIYTDQIVSKSEDTAKTIADAILESVEEIFTDAEIRKTGDTVSVISENSNFIMNISVNEEEIIDGVLDIAKIKKPIFDMFA